MADLKPHLDHLSKKHKDDKKRLQEEQLRLYKEMGVNPAAGCLPLLLQFPVLIALYQVFSNLLSNGNLDALITDINRILYVPILRIESIDLSFFGINLGVKPDQWQTHGVFLLAIPVVTALLQFIQAKFMPGYQTPKKEEKTLVKIDDGKKESTSDDMQKAMQTQMLYFMPLFLGYLAFSFPVGLSLYWNTFSVFGIIQQVIVNRKPNAKMQNNK